MIKIEHETLPGGVLALAFECRTEEETTDLDGIFTLLASGLRPRSGWVNSRRFVLQYRESDVALLLASGPDLPKTPEAKQPTQPAQPIVRDFTAMPVPKSST